MRLLQLYLQSHRAGFAALLAAAAAPGRGIRTWVLRLPLGEDPTGFTVAPVLFVLPPLLATCIVGLSTCLPLGDIEETASRSLPALGLLATGLCAVCLHGARDGQGSAE